MSLRAFPFTQLAPCEGQENPMTVARECAACANGFSGIKRGIMSVINGSKLQR